MLGSEASIGELSHSLNPSQGWQRDQEGQGGTDSKEGEKAKDPPSWVLKCVFSLAGSLE